MPHQSLDEAAPNDAAFVDAVCLGCGCLCDDVRLSLSGDEISADRLACDKGNAWFGSLDRRAAPLDPAKLGEAAEILAGAQFPLVCGLQSAASDAQRTAVGIADQLGGCVDWTTGASDTAPVVAWQTLGGVSASLGEVAQRADLVVFWRCNPAETHPRHFERFSLEPPSPWLPRGRADRQSVLIGDRSWKTGDSVDLVIESDEQADLSAISKLRSLLAGERPDGPEHSVWAALADRILRSRFTVIFHGNALEQQGLGLLTQLTHLAQGVQGATRLVTQTLGSGGNAAGAARVMAWQTGYPMAVSFANGYPEYGPDEFSTESLLKSGDADAALVVAADGVAGLSEAALDRLRRIPSVVLGTGDLSHLSPGVQFSVPPLGAKPGGSVYRCDGLVLPLEHDLAPGAPSRQAVLKQISERLETAATTAARDR